MNKPSTSPVDKYLSEFGSEYGVEEPVWRLLRWATSRAQTPEGAAQLLRNSLGCRTRRRPWEEDVYLDAMRGAPLLLQALAWMQEGLE